MVFFNYALRKLNAKIVYYGPGLCGKTTNLQWIHDHFEGGQRGKMISLSTEGDRTIFFDLLPLEIGTIRGMEVTLQLYTVPGQVHYNSTRQLVLRGADGVVFVADSQRTMRQSNVESLRNLQENLMLQGVDLKDFPHVLQFNKRDLKDLITIEEMDRELNLYSVPFFEAIATEGVGVQETLEGIVKLVMRSLRERYEPVVAPAARTDAPQPMPVGVPPGGGAPRQEPPPPQPRPVVPVRPPPPTAPPPRPSPFDASADQDNVSTGVYAGSRAPEAARPDRSVNLTTASVEKAPKEFPGALKPPPPEALALPDEPTKVREIPGIDFAGEGEPAARRPQRPASPPPRGRAPDVPPAQRPPASAPPVAPDFAMPFADKETDASIPLPGTEEPAFPPIGDDDQFAFGAVEPTPPAGPPEEEAPLSSPGLFSEGLDESGFESDIEVGGASFPPVGPDDLEAAGLDDEGEAEAEDDHPPPVGHGPSPDETPTVVPRRVPGGSVDDLVASVLGSTVPRFREPVRPPARPASTPPAPRSLPPSEPPSPPALEPPSPRPSQPVSAPPSPRASAPPSPPPFPQPSAPSGRHRPTKLGEGDPFAMPAPETPPGGYVLAPAGPSKGMVRLGDNQLHLRLQGTGAIAESGQVRALDIEVPVPGSWVGNRRVTLQLRLTLSPVPEDEDGGPGDTS